MSAVSASQEGRSVIYKNLNFRRANNDVTYCNN